MRKLMAIIVFSSLSYTAQAAQSGLAIKSDAILHNKSILNLSTGCQAIDKHFAGMYELSIDLVVDKEKFSFDAIITATSLEDKLFAITSDADETWLYSIKKIGNGDKATCALLNVFDEGNLVLIDFDQVNFNFFKFKDDSKNATYLFKKRQ
ncbi:MAG: hypothetical protein A2Z20_03580 [Bdellovibrionales bacterium RBG_16_40_8]|nr:MAG: hypothetical protein A2Z20_03580 [Bdellovibrionales bacterium RBG_16_40_8]